MLVFSHVPPLARLHVWSDRIRASGPVMQLLADFHAAHGGAVLGWIHGHNHTDQVYRGAAFPIVSIGCGKLESFPEHKPEGTTTFERLAGRYGSRYMEVPDPQKRVCHTDVFFDPDSPWTAHVGKRR